MTGTYVAHGVTLALAWFALANLLVSGVGVAIGSRLAAEPRARSAGFWFALRCVPVAASLAFVAAVFVPSYLQFEPRETVERFDITVTAIAAFALFAVAAAAVRGGRAWRRSSHQTARWLRGAQPLAAAAADVPAFTVRVTSTPLMALVGISSPRVIVSERLVDALSPEELGATLAHEAAHARSRDNLKRLVMRLLPDALAGTSTAAAIEQRWATASEHAADRAATAGDATARCTLASALVKVARLMAPTDAAAEPTSTLVGGGDLAARIELLLDEAPAVRRSNMHRWIAAGAVVGAVAAYAPLLHAVHEVTEILVNSLP